MNLRMRKLTNFDLLLFSSGEEKCLFSVLPAATRCLKLKLWGDTHKAVDKVPRDNARAVALRLNKKENKWTAWMDVYREKATKISEDAEDLVKFVVRTNGGKLPPEEFIKRHFPLWFLPEHQAA